MCECKHFLILFSFPVAQYISGSQLSQTALLPAPTPQTPVINVQGASPPPSVKKSKKKKFPVSSNMAWCERKADSLNIGSVLGTPFRANTTSEWL